MFVRVGADTSGLQRGMRQAEGSVRQFGRATQSVNLDRLRGPLTTVAAQLTGMNAAFGTLASTLVSMAAGGGVAALAIGGITAIGFAMRKMREETEKANKAIEEARKLLTGLAPGGEKQAEAIRAALGTERTRLRGLEGQRGDVEARLLAGQRMTPSQRRLFDVDLAALQTQLAELEKQVLESKDAIFLGELALQNLIPRLDGVTASVEKLGEQAKATLGDFGLPGSGALIPQAEAARAALAAGKAPPQPEWLRRALSLNLRPTTPDSVAGAGKLDNAVSKFQDAVDSFGQGVKDVVAGAFSTGGLANIGANLASQGIGFLAGKIFEGIGSLFGGVSNAMSKLALAMEQNTRALRASADFLGKRLTGAGLDDEAAKVSKVLEEVLSTAAVSPTGRVNIDQLRRGLEQAGISLEDFHAIAKLLGINLENLSIEALTQFWEQIDKATAGLGGLTDQINEALRNFPTLFNPNLARFRAGGLTAPTSGGIGNRIDPITAAAVQINGPITVVASDPEVFVSKLRQKARRGGPSAVRMAY